MASKSPTIFRVAVEGIVDEAVIRRIITDVGASIDNVYGKKGKGTLFQKKDAYNHAARFSNWVLLVDLDHEEGCAPPLLKKWLPQPAPRMCLRVAVRSIEAWLLADRRKIADFLRVPFSRVPRNPDDLDNPKQTMVSLAAGSSNRAIKTDMLPRAGSQLSIGPAYSSRLIEYASTFWRPTIAMKTSDSLKRCVFKLRKMIEVSS